MLFAVAAMAFNSCAIDEGVTEKTDVKVEFSTIADDSRTHFGEADGTKYPTLWTGDESVLVSLNYAKEVAVDVTASEDFKTAKFNATLKDDNSGAYTIYALCPESATYNSINSSYKSWSIEIPAEQTPSANSCDEAAQIIAAKSTTTSVLPTSVDLAFKHVTAYGKMSLNNLELENATIKSVSLIAADNIAGRHYYYAETDEISSASGAVKILTINTNSTKDIWFACVPTTTLANTDLEVVVTTDAGTISKTITLPENFVFSAGRIAKFAINMADATQAGVVKYELVTSAADLATGDQVIIAGATFDTAISTNQKSNNRGQATVTKEGNFIVSPGVDVEIFNIVKLSDEDGEFNYYAFESSTGNYLYAPGTGNHLRSSGVVYNNSLWTINVQTNGVSAIVNENDVTQRYLRYNDSSTLFSCYATGAQKDVALYVKKGDGSYIAAPIFVAVPNATEVEAKTTEAFFTVKSNVEWTAEITTEGASFDESATVTTMSGSNVAEVYLYFAENTEATTKAHTVKVTTTADANTTEYTFTFTQAAVATGTPETQTGYYTKVTEALSDWSGTYLLVYEHAENVGYAFNGADAVNGYAEVAISDNKIEVNETNAVNEIIIATMNGGYSLQINSESKYNAEKYIGGKAANSNGLVFNVSPVANTINFASGVAEIISNTNVFTFNKTANQMRFRYYKSATASGYPKPALYKKAE